MDIVLGHASSMDFWRLKRPRSHTLRTLGRRSEPAGFHSPAHNGIGKPSPSDLGRIERLGINPRPRPIQLMVPDASLRVRSANITCSVFDKRIPPSSFVQVDEGVFVASPELCILMEALESPFERLVETGFEFCGTYRMPAAAHGDLLSDQPALTSVSKLCDFVDRARKPNGIGAVRQAVRHILEGSESPKETHLAILSCFPGRLGGYGFSQARLNYPVRIPEKARGRHVGRICRCDLYWPEAKLDVEYDSRLHHSGEKEQAKDSARRTALAHEGILVISVTREQLHTRSEMDKVANAMAKRLGQRLRPRAVDWEVKHLRLRTSLLCSPDSRF